MKILNYSFLNINEKAFNIKRTYDNISFFEEVTLKKYDVILSDFSFYTDIKEIRDFFDGYIVFLVEECSLLYFKKALEIGDFCYSYYEYEKILMRLNYLRKKIYKKEILKFSEFVYNFKTRTLYYKSNLVNLTKAENEVLHLLIKNRNRFVSKDEILESSDFIESIKSIKVIISHLRKRGIEIVNKKNLGYKINIKE